MKNSPRVREIEFQRRITDLCDWLKLTWHHETDSRRTRAGFPDLVIVGNAVIFVELKSQRGRVSPEQQAWLDALMRAGVEAHVWRPDDWPLVAERLKALAT